MVGEYPLAVDIPNHAARLFVECNQHDPTLSRMYSVQYSLIPNLAIDLLNRPLCGLVDPLVFLRATLISTMAGILVVVWFLHRFLNQQATAFVLLAPAMSFNVITSMGYLNYLIGTFLFLLFAWSMLRFDILWRHKALAIALPNLFGAAIFLCHIFALGLAGVFLFGLRFTAERDRPLMARLVRAGLLTAVSFAIPFLMILLADRSGTGIFYALSAKARALWSPVLFSSVYVAAALAFLWIALFYWVFRERYVAIAKPLRWALLFLLAFSLALPSGLLDAVDIDSRCFVSVFYLAIAGLVVRRRNGRPQRAELAAGAVALVTIAAHLMVLMHNVRVFDRQVAEFRSAITVLPAMASVLSVTDLDPNSPVPRRFYSHLGSYATVDRKIFNPAEFTGKGMQPLVVKREFACLDIPAGWPVPTEIIGELSKPETASLMDTKKFRPYDYAYRWDRNFDYVVHFHFGARANPVPSQLKAVREGSFFTIYRTPRTTPSPDPCTQQSGSR